MANVQSSHHSLFFSVCLSHLIHFGGSSPFNEKEWVIKEWPMCSRAITVSSFLFPILKECIVCPWRNRKEETVMAQLHIGHSFITHSFLLKGEEPPKCIGCDKRLTVEHILLTCSDFIEIRESHFTAKSLRMLFQDILPEKIFNFLKEINMFGKI